MTNEMAARKREIDAVFYTALKLEDVEMRTRFLNMACDGDEELRVAVEQLLGARGDLDEIFEQPARHFDVSAEDIEAVVQADVSDEIWQADEKAGSRIGRYRLIDRMGEGGCGVVYEAEQTEPMSRRVALKIIKTGMDSRSVIARFDMERQALAMMDHPNIAHVFDAGATETGRPYFVMELVQGVRITDYCDEHKLDVPRRLGLFVHVCRAIEHAHQKGIIHRDIKPSNILVTLQDGAPVVKVIDFGIAKAMDGSPGGQAASSACEPFMGTPAYMSPEQAETGGLDVDTRSDIYSLGVLLHELLAGRTPLDTEGLKKGGLDAFRRMLREQDPPRPSVVLAGMQEAGRAIAVARHLDRSQQLVSILKGDLDCIVMKALDRDRTHRYETAGGLAMDILRYLNHEPVAAHPPSRFYQCRKLVRRNRVLFAAVSVVVASLLFGLGLSTWLFVEKNVALKEQIRLREETERLLRSAKARQRLTEAHQAFRLDNIDEADRLVAAIQTPAPNLEYVDLYRALADTRGTNGEWQAVADRCAVLLQVRQPEDWISMPIDYLRYGTALVKTGDTEGYDRFRHYMISNSLRTSNGLVADCVIKMSLLWRPDLNVLAALQPLALTASNSTVHFTDAAWLVTWRAFSMALLEYRRGNLAGVEEWHERADAIRAYSTSCDACFQTLMAMTHYRAGRTDQARLELSKARLTIESKVNQRPIEFFWFDWLYADVLSSEAVEMMIGRGNSNAEVSGLDRRSDEVPYSAQQGGCQIRRQSPLP
jgi:serine/threonine protein kinase